MRESFLPTDAELVRRIATVYQEPAVSLIEREALGSGSFPKEVVSCRVGTGEIQRLFCKYSAPRDQAFGHRGGLPYEARIYGEILARLLLRTPRLIGSGTDPAGGTWLMLEALEEAVRLEADWHRMPDAAGWLGKFHREAIERIQPESPSFLITYDREYYCGWAERTLSHARQLRMDLPWLDSLATEFSHGLSALLHDGERTLIHGEFTVKNVMISSGDMCPTDWESAAWAAGEVDLACLVDGCDSDLVSTCVERYASSRWPSEAPTAFAGRLLFAEIYLHFRWLGDVSAELDDERLRSRFQRLREIANGLGLESVPPA